MSQPPQLQEPRHAAAPHARQKWGLSVLVATYVARMANFSLPALVSAVRGVITFAVGGDEFALGNLVEDDPEDAVRAD